MEESDRFTVVCKQKAKCSICDSTIQPGDSMVIIKPTDTTGWTFQCTNQERNRELSKFIKENPEYRLSFY